MPYRIHGTIGARAVTLTQVGTSSEAEARALVAVTDPQVVVARIEHVERLDVDAARAEVEAEASKTNTAPAEAE